MLSRRRVQAARRIVKGKRQNVVEVTLEGEGKLGLVFAKDSEPPQIKEVKPGGLAAKVRCQHDTTLLSVAATDVSKSLPTAGDSQAC